MPRCGHNSEPLTTNVLHVTGGVYKGTFVNGLKDGFGVMKFRADSAYEGQWKSNRFHGKGAYLWADGRIYQGQHTSLFFTCLFFLSIISCTICCVNFFSFYLPFHVPLFSCLCYKKYCCSVCRLKGIVMAPCGLIVTHRPGPITDGNSQRTN